VVLTEDGESMAAQLHVTPPAGGPAAPAEADSGAAGSVGDGDEASDAAEVPLAAQRAVLDRISEFYRLAELVGCQPTGSVSNEQRFSDVNNIKTKLRSSLGLPHLNACVRIATTSHTLDTFPFAAAYEFWSPPGGTSRYGG